MLVGLKELPLYISSLQTLDDHIDVDEQDQVGFDATELEQVFISHSLLRQCGAVDAAVPMHTRLVNSFPLCGRCLAQLKLLEGYDASLSDSGDEDVSLQLDFESLVRGLVLWLRDKRLAYRVS